MAESQKLQYVTLDVFTKTRYQGNQLAIVRVPPNVHLTQEQKQRIASEFNYSETVILQENNPGYDKPEWSVNIFIATAEIPLAGHPVIGTSYYLAQSLKDNEAGLRQGTLHTKAGPVVFNYAPSSRRAEVDIPHDVHFHPVFLSQELASEHNIPQEVVNNMHGPAPIFSLVKGMTFALIELPNLETLSLLTTNLKELNIDGLTEAWKGLIGTFFFVRQGKSEDGAICARTRMFLGSREDAATGSASCALASYLALFDPSCEVQTGGLHRFEFTQGVEMGRKSVLAVDVYSERPSEVKKLTIKGSAVEVMGGALTPPP